MSLPTYDKSKRKKNFEMLPKGAYVIKIMNAFEEPNRSGNGSHLTISFDIAEGDYKDFYANQYHANTNEDKKWSRQDGKYKFILSADGSTCKVPLGAFDSDECENDIMIVIKALEDY